MSFLVEGKDDKLLIMQKEGKGRLYYRIGAFNSSSVFVGDLLFSLTNAQALTRAVAVVSQA